MAFKSLRPHGFKLPSVGSVRGRTVNVVRETGARIVDGLALVFVGGSGMLGLRYPVTSHQRPVAPGLTRGSRLQERDYAQLKSEGYKTIIDLTAEGTADSKHGEVNGLKVVRIKVLDSWHPSNAQMTEFLDTVTRKENQPAYVHCQAGKGRTGVFVAGYRMAVQNRPLDQALEEARRLGVKMPNQLRFITGFSHALKAGKIPGYPLKAGEPRDSDIFE
jgi:protein-tyrosine phosphatase